MVLIGKLNMNNKEIAKKIKELYDKINNNDKEPPSYLWIDSDKLEEVRGWWKNDLTGYTKI